MVTLGKVDSDGYIAVTYSMRSCTEQTEGKLQLTAQRLGINLASAGFCKNCEPLFSGLPKMASNSQTKGTELSTVYHNVALLAICKRTKIKQIYQFVLRNKTSLSEKLLGLTVTY